jgi:hypothetical protein
VLAGRAESGRAFRGVSHQSASQPPAAACQGTCATVCSWFREGTAASCLTPSMNAAACVFHRRRVHLCGIHGHPAEYAASASEGLQIALGFGSMCLSSCAAPGLMLQLWRRAVGCMWWEAVPGSWSILVSAKTWMGSMQPSMYGCTVLLNAAEGIAAAEVGLRHLRCLLLAIRCWSVRWCLVAIWVCGPLSSA